MVKTTEQEINNIIAMIGSSEKQFKQVIHGLQNISMSSGSHYSDFAIFGDCRLIATYDCKGNLKTLYY